MNLKSTSQPSEVGQVSKHGADVFKQTYMQHVCIIIITGCHTLKKIQYLRMNSFTGKVVIVGKLSGRPTTMCKISFGGVLADIVLALRKEPSVRAGAVWSRRFEQ